MANATSTSAGISTVLLAAAGCTSAAPKKRRTASRSGRVVRATPTAPTARTDTGTPYAAARTGRTTVLRPSTTSISRTTRAEGRKATTTAAASVDVQTRTNTGATTKRSEGRAARVDCECRIGSRGNSRLLPGRAITGRRGTTSRPGSNRIGFRAAKLRGGKCSVHKRAAATTTATAGRARTSLPGAATTRATSTDQYQSDVTGRSVLGPCLCSTSREAVE